MALSRTALTTGKNSAASSLTTASVTLSAGDLLIVRCAAFKFFPAQDVTGISWNGQSLTAAVARTGTPGGQASFNHCSLWYLHVPAGASAAVVVTFAGINDGSYVEVFRYTGHNATTPIGDTDSTEQNNSSGVPPSLTLDTASGDDVLDVLSQEAYGASTFTVGPGQTENYADFISDGVGAIRTSTEAASGASVAVSWSRSDDFGYVYAAAVVKAAGGGGGGGGGAIIINAISALLLMVI